MQTFPLIFQLKNFREEWKINSTESATFRCYSFYMLHWQMFRSSCPEVFCEKGVLRNFIQFAGKHLCQSLFLKEKLWHRCFHMNFAKFLRTPFLAEHLWWLLLVKLTWSKSWRLLLRAAFLVFYFYLVLLGFNNKRLIKRY